MIEVIAPSGIDVRRLRVGTVIFVETETCLYELTVTNPVYGLMKVNSTDLALREMPLGQLVESRYKSGNGPSMPYWIGKGLVMEIRFSNGKYQSPVVGSVVLKGRREDGTSWSYDVF